ncbi:MAG: alpha/beta hydrolase fold protein [Polaromonas sp.]|nr:alpha/beta hydrolase fold protein [Polaromonas sp.]
MVWHVWTPEGGETALAPVVLLHGGSGSWTHWVRNITGLVSQGRRVYVPDLPGFGASALPPAGIDADALQFPVEEGLQALLGEVACDVVGFSFGGMVAGFLASGFPGRVARLVLSGAPGLGIAPRQKVDLKAWRHLADPAAREAAHRFNLAALMLHDSASIDDLALWLQAANVPRDRLKRRRLARTDALARVLGTLLCPVHAIYGAEDVLYLGRTEALAQVLALAPGFRGLTLIEGAGHWVQFERADAFNVALRAVLDQAPSP